MSNKFLLSFPPHLRSKNAVFIQNYEMMIALVPSLLGAIWVFRLKAVAVVTVTLISSLITYFLFGLFSKEWRVWDSSVLLTSLLFAFLLPATIPLWLVVFGAFLTVIFSKQVMGQSIFNAVLISKVFVLFCWPTVSKSWLISEGTKPFWSEEFLLGPNLFFEHFGGGIGEISLILILVGAFYLLVRKIIKWRISLSFLITLIIGSFFGGGTTALDRLFFQVCLGGTLLAAFFFVTDSLTSPVTKKGQIIFGLGIGILTLLLRFLSKSQESWIVAVLLMNIFVPLIDEYTWPRPFGVKR
ncbi:MAG: RnfABCDGE type electron transport complex subunit D [Candidatus Edwardsbacteria bacterium]